jgi:hypothetical protein
MGVYMNKILVLKTLLIGLLAGALSGVLGIGGGIILVPALAAVIGFNQSRAQGTSLALFSLPVAAVAAYSYYTHGYVDLPALPWLALGFVVGGILGSRVAVYLPANILTKVFGFALLGVGIKMLF